MTTTVAGHTVKGIDGEVLTAAALNAMNTFDRPDVVKPARFTGHRLQGSQLTLSIPAKSVVMLELR